MRYCVRLINAMRSKIPKIVLDIHGIQLFRRGPSFARCELMENGPLPDFVLHCGALKLQVCGYGNNEMGLAD
jgi:hypothetical protein